MTKHRNEAVTMTRASKKRLVLTAKAGITHSLLTLLMLVLAASNIQAGSKYRNKRFDHKIQFQLFDIFDYPVENTEFWTTIKVHKEGERVTLSFPAINFETGQFATNDSDVISNPPPVLAPPFSAFTNGGGTLRAVNGFLPECVRPTDSQYRSYLVPSNNGQSEAFKFELNSTFADLPQPPSGYILGISFFGGITIQGAGTFNNVILAGPQIMLPTDVSYYHEKSKKLCKNTQISTGQIDVSQFALPWSYDGIRDTAVNDAYAGVTAWAWADNSNISPTNNTVNCFVAIGEVINGKLEVNAPIQLTDLPAGVMVVDVAVAINRSKPQNIVVSYGLIDYINPGSPRAPCRAVSKDGGKTWSSPYPYIIQFVILSSDISGHATMTLAPVPPGGVNYGSLEVGQTVFPMYIPSPYSVAPNTVITGNPSAGVYTLSNTQLNIAPIPASTITGSIDGTTSSLTVTSGTVFPLPIFQLLTGPGIPAGTFINGLNVDGTYNLSPAVITSIPSETMQITIVVPMLASAPDPISGLLNGPIDILSQNAFGFGDNRGVSSDTFGNIWYSSANYFDAQANTNDAPVFAASTTEGDTFETIYSLPITAPFVPGNDFWDFPQYCFGGDGNGHYGLWFGVRYLPNYFTSDGENVIHTVGFIPIQGLGSFGPIPLSTPSFLTSLENTISGANVTASQNGRVWFDGVPKSELGIRPRSVLFKSPPNSIYPDPITSNYAGAWQTSMVESFAVGNQDLPPVQIFSWDSFPLIGYFNTAQVILYDENRKALYALICGNAPDFSQNMRLYLIISRNNGESWSQPYFISSTDFANRGFQSMALDTKTGDLVFGWYDGRNDSQMKKMQYFGAVLPAEKLDCLVNNIPYSDPVFVSPPATGPLPPGKSVVGQPKVSSIVGGKKTEGRKNKFARRAELRKIFGLPKKG